MIATRNDTEGTNLRRDLTRRIAKLQTSIHRRETRLRKLRQEPPTTKQVLKLTDGGGTDLALPVTTRKAVHDHDASNYGGGEDIANERLQRWCSRRRAARLDNNTGRRTALDASTIETLLTNQARYLRKACRDNVTSSQILCTLGKHSAGACGRHQPLDRQPRVATHNVDNSQAPNVT